METSQLSCLWTAPMSAAQRMTEATSTEHKAWWMVLQIRRSGLLLQCSLQVRRRASGLASTKMTASLQRPKNMRTCWLA